MSFFRKFSYHKSIRMSAAAIAKLNSPSGEFIRPASAVRDIVGAPDGKYPAVPGRYHLYVAYNCPWCHRCILTRSLLGLQDVISMDVCFPLRTEADHPSGESRWQFCPEGRMGLNKRHYKFDSCTSDSVNGMPTVYDINKMCNHDLNSVPLLFDKETNTCVNNDSAEIIRMMATAFKRFSSPNVDLYPASLGADIDQYNEWIHAEINNGAYKAGFSSAQEFYELAYHKYFDAFDKLDRIFRDRKFLCGDAISEADVRLFPTIFRHDPIYYLRFKLNKAYVREYPNLWRWLCDMYKIPAVSSESPLEPMKVGYFGRTPNNIIPVGPPGYPEVLLENHSNL